jgi:hypothetical protein
MNKQLELIARRAPKVSAKEVELLLNILRGQSWMTAMHITLESKYHIGQQVRWSDRKIRAIANASEGQVISGQRGYRLTREATIEEVQHAAAWLRHQARAMRLRALEIDRVYHGKVVA